MAKQTAKDDSMKKVWINAFKTFGKILLGIAVCFCFFTASLFYLSPMNAAKLFNFLNLKNAEETCYEYAYSKDKTITSLYNLVLFEMDMGNPEIELYYLNLLLSDENYGDFCEKLDASSLGEITNKALVAYSCNANSFLINQKVKCMYNLHMINPASSATENFVKQKLEEHDTVEHSFSTYVDLVLNDSSLSDGRKIDLLNSLILNDEFNKNLDVKIQNLKLQAQNQTGNKRLVVQNSLVSLCRGRYLAYSKCYDESNEKIEFAKEEYLTEYEIYKSLIKN